jgi:hypothetical protein
MPIELARTEGRMIPLVLDDLFLGDHRKRGQVAHRRDRSGIHTGGIPQMAVERHLRVGVAKMLPQPLVRGIRVLHAIQF